MKHPAEISLAPIAFPRGSCKMNDGSFTMLMPRKSRRSPEKYAAILRAATKVFARNGFFNSKVTDVAREAGVADGTVYLYFKNKDDILISLFNQTMDEAIAAGRQTLPAMSDPIAKLRQVAYLHLDRLGRDRNLAVVFQVELEAVDTSLWSGSRRPGSRSTSVSSGASCRMGSMQGFSVTDWIPIWPPRSSLEPLTRWPPTGFSADADTHW